MLNFCVPSLVFVNGSQALYVNRVFLGCINYLLLVKTISFILYVVLACSIILKQK